MSRRKWIVPGCALLVILLVGLLLLSAPTAIALRLAGFRSEGRTEDFLDEQASSVPPTILWSADSRAALSQTPTPSAATSPGAASPAEGVSPAAEPQSIPGPLDEVLIDIWFLSQPTSFGADEIYAQKLERGLVNGDQVAYYIEFDELGLNTYLGHWFGEYVVQTDRVRDVSIDLVPGGAMIYADVNLELGWQHVGAAFMLDPNGRQLSLVGVDIDGRFYSTPPAGSVAELARQLETQSNRALRDLVFIDPAGRLVIRQISLGPDQAQILAY